MKKYVFWVLLQIFCAFSAEAGIVRVHPSVHENVRPHADSSVRESVHEYTPPTTEQVRPAITSEPTRTPQVAETKSRPYGHIQDPKGVGQGKDFTASQKKAILAENRSNNGGKLRDDQTGRYLANPKKSQKGIAPSKNEAQIDHIVPKKPSNPHVTPGGNSYSNAQVISRESNRAKSNN